MKSPEELERERVVQYILEQYPWLTESIIKSLPDGELELLHIHIKQEMSKRSKR